jgi:hypothetical protein
MKKCVKISVNLWSKGDADEKEIYINMGIREFAKEILGIDYRETEDVDAIDLDIEEIEVLELER